MDTNVRKVGREVPGFGYKVRRLGVKSRGSDTKSKGRMRSPKVAG